jgi:hypothetical protein
MNMSLEYWPILGYGVEVTEEMLDPEKVNKILGIDKDDLCLWDVLEKICSLPKAQDILTWSTTGEMYAYDVGYVYCPSVLPWEAVKEPWCNITKEQVEESIRTVLAPLLRNGEELEFEEIAEVGCS